MIFINTSITASAYTGHSQCILNGVYANNKQHNLVFLINTSAVNSVVTIDLYEGMKTWNNISNNVNVNYYQYVPGMPSSGFMQVIGDTLSGFTLGLTTFYDSNGNAVDMNSNCSSVCIRINNDPAVFQLNATSNFTASDIAQKTIIHETGHALKLDHPVVNSSLSYHSTYFNNGKPVSVMNSGFPFTINEAYISRVVTSHDKLELKYKWD